MIILEYIYIQEFGSIVEEVKYKLNRPGLNLVLGPNGVGKTTIFNALSWALYKQPLKKGSTIEPWPHVLDSNWQGTKVTVDFYDQDSGKRFRVIRCNNFKGKLPELQGKRGASGLYLFEDGNPVFTERDKSDQNKWIQEKLGYSFELFKSTILFGQKVKRLTEEAGPDKKKIFDEAFETLFISRARDITDRRLKDKQNTRVILTNKLESHRGLLEKSKTELIRAQNAFENFQGGQQSRVDEAKARIAQVVEEIGHWAKNFNTQANKEIRRDLEEKVKELTLNLNPKFKDKEFELMLTKNRTLDKIENLERDSKKLRIELKNLPEECPKCNQKIPKKTSKDYKDNLSNKIDGNEAEIEILKSQLEQAEKDIQEVKEKLVDMDKVKEKIFKTQLKLKTAQDALKEFEWKNTELQKQLVAAKEAENRLFLEKPPSFNLREIRKELKGAKVALRNIKAELKTLTKSIRIDEWLLKDPLSNAGLKAFIFDSMLGRVNNHLKAYQDITGFGVKVYVEMSSARKDICISVFRNGNEVPYEDLSGGQKQLVDVSLAFALHDTVSKLKPLNVLLMDEVFESLDQNNVELVGSMLQRLSLTKSVHLITHHSKFQPVHSYTTFISLNDKNHTQIEIKFRQN